ncbi:MAG: HAD-IIB family hydrolase [Desulfurococcaceae archaeon]
MFKALKYRALIFTDIDGTLINGGLSEDLGYYINRLNSLGFPVIPVTMKTISEVIYLWNKLGADLSAAIVEGGGAIYYSNDFTLSKGLYDHCIDMYFIKVAKCLTEIENYLKVLEGKCSSKVLRLTKLPPELISELTNLSLEEAVLARKRYFSEAFYTSEAMCFKEIAEEAKSIGLTTMVTDKFIHVSTSSKGRAVGEFLRNSFFKHLPTIGLGDSELDEDFLELTDVAIVISSNKRISLRRLDYIISTESPPKGWIKAVEGTIIKFI